MANTKIPSELIADSSITAAKLADGTITTADIADSNVTTAKIADSNVTTAKIGDAQVTTAKITDANVTTGKIADDAVTTAKMASNSVTSDTIASGITLAGTTTLSSHLVMGDNDIIKLGDSSDLQIYHDGSNSIINDAGTGTIRIQTAGANQWEFNGLNFKGNDGRKIILGDSSDLQIYHDGSNSYVADRGTGNLRLEGTNIALNNQGSNKTYLLATDGGSVQLRHNDVAKLETTSTGIDVTGSVTSDGLVVDGVAEISSTTPTLRFFETDQTNEGTLLRSAGDSFQIAKMLDTGAADGIRLAVDQSSGDISFYEDTGTSQALFWDASAESLGIGTTSPGAKLEIKSNLTHIRLKRTDGAGDDWKFYAWESGLNIFPASASTVFFGRDGASTDVELYNGNLNVRTGIVKIGGTTVIDASRNLTNIGTISSGAITSSGVFTNTNSSGLGIQTSGYSLLSAANNARAASGSLRLGNGAGSTGLVIDYTDQGQTVATIRNVYVASNTSELTIQSPFITFDTGTSYTQALLLDHNQNATFAGNVEIVDTLSVGTTSTLKGYFYESTADQNGDTKPSSVLGLAANVNSRGEGPSIDFNAVWGGAGAYQQDNWNEGWTVGRIAGVYDLAGLDTGALAFYTQTSGSSGGSSSTSLTEKMRIDSSGNVGIGTTDPSALLEVSGGAPTFILNANSQATNKKKIRLAASQFTAGDFNIQQMNDNGTTVALTAMTIKNGGNVGIGETSPANLLHVKASDAGIAPHPSAQIVLERDGTNYLQFLTTAAGTSGVLFGDTNDIDVSKIYVDHNTTKMTFVNETAETMTLHGTKVGIGTSIPSNKFGVKVTSINTNERMINLYTGTTGPGKYVSIGAQYSETNLLSNSEIRFGNEVQSNAPSFLAFATGNTTTPAERMRIDSIGNVGIGITTPNDGKLQVYGNSTSDWAGYFYNQNTSGIGLHVETNAHGTEQLLRLSSLNGSGGSNTVKMVVRADGNVGIGTTVPYSKLHVDGAVTSSNSDNDLLTHTYSSYASRVGSGRIDVTSGYSGTLASGRKFIFKYNATSWKAYHGRITLSGTGGFASYEFGGYWNNSGGSQTEEMHDALQSSCAITTSGQAIVVTITIGQTVVHPCLSVEYNQSGGDGAPRMDRAEFFIQ